MHRLLAATAALAAVLAGCTSTPTAPPLLDLPPASAYDANVPSLATWWKAFGDPTLDAMIDEALANNLDLRAAIVRVDYARAQVLLAQSFLLPNVELDAGANRNRISQVSAIPLQPGTSPYGSSFSVGLQASYEIDLWGKLRDSTRAAQNDLLASQYASQTVRTAVAAETARGYFRLLAADAQLALLQDTLKTREETVALQQDRYDAGVIGEFDLRTAEAERANVAADIAYASRAVAEFESALAVLLGRSPRQVYAPALAREVAMARLTTVPEIPSGLPSDILARRPDIRQAEALLAAASLRIDAARADYFPSISLTGAYGTEAGALKNLFTGPALAWGIGASLVQPLFSLKAIEANVETRTTRREEVVVAYTQAVQGAFRDAHDALAADATSRAALAAQTERKNKLSQALELSDLRYTSGYSPYLEVLDSQRQLLQAQALQIVAARNVRLAVVDVAKAFGGGWEDSTAVQPPTALVGRGSGATP